MGKAAASSYAGRLALYDRLVATNPKVERKGATMPYTSLSGNMFSLLTKEGRLALRLPPVEREAFLTKYRATLCTQHGVVLVEYVEVPDALLERTPELKRWFDASYTYAKSLKPKPTTRKKQAAAKKKA
jgi:TfoX/Sxy family transcriptional regulator of competence genes